MHKVGTLHSYFSLLFHFFHTINLIYVFPKSLNFLQIHETKVFNHVFFDIKFDLFAVYQVFQVFVICVILDSVHGNSIISMFFTQINVGHVLLYGNEMKPTAIKFSVKLICTQLTGINLILVKNAFVFVSHDTKEFVIHGSFLETIHKIFFFHKINDSITE